MRSDSVKSDLEYIKEKQIDKLSTLDEKHRLNAYEFIMLELVHNIAKSLETIAKKTKEGKG